MFNYYPQEKVSIFLGAYGSGKSEVSVNFAIMLSKSLKTNNLDFSATTASNFKKIVLADLDIINPFFRSADAVKLLEEYGVKTIVPQFANTNVEVPAVSPAVYSIFDQPEIRGILDIGGEDMGARIVNNLKNRIEGVDYKIYMVVNMLRPFTDSILKVKNMIGILEESAGLKIGGLVNNTNLLEHTDPVEFLFCEKQLIEISKEKQTPLLFSAGMTEIYPDEWGDKTPNDIPFLRMQRSIIYE